MSMHLTIKSIYEKFIIEIDYNHPDGERHYGIITRNPEYIDGEIQPDEDDNYIAYDLLTKKWIRANIKSNTGFTITPGNINAADGKPMDNPFALSEIHDEDIIQAANTALLIKIKARQTAIDEALKEAERLNITVGDEDKLYYYSLFSSYGFNSYPDDKSSVLAILVIAQQSYLKVLANKPTKKELKIAQTNWLKVIDDRIDFALSELDREKMVLDPAGEEYEYEIEEIETIKTLIKNLHDEYKSKLQETVDYKDVIQVWPPLLLPRPPLVEQWSILEDAFYEEVESK